ncbi:Bug family tripartite tricarboxylate transporter substrate binding protein [Bradyrhizobium yuanmingense]|uniref:Bug family tripartite tricarboxylate transporter substrate binding protein n=1 Tax=Bradyrhizobium yuanmingense TaxID=108015 RepID=UPI0023B9958F|nr:tripartite tricarboxylate transporter substrate binding protein [Bradyrhizobium yuanmingense]MDF0495024.1 tripartite tricarboxylate transporter substrate binding protein [Bradyrhizobium yuanmingense]
MLTRAGAISTALMLAIAMTVPGRAKAQEFPSRPLSILVIYPAGGPADLMARALAEVLRERLGQPVIVENKPGAGGQIAGTALIRAPADGHTLLIGDTASLGINKAVYANFSYDPLTGLEPVAPLMLMPMLLYVPKSSPFNSTADLVAAAKSKALNYASQGNGSLGHLLGEMLKADAAIQLVHVPYRGSAPAMQDLIGSQVDLLFDGLGPGLPNVSANNIKALFVAGPQRLPQLPNVPTADEVRLPNVVMSLWLGVVVRAGTPEPVVQRLSEEVGYAMRQPQVTKRFLDLGFQILNMTRAEFREFVKNEAGKSTALVKARGISAE